MNRKISRRQFLQASGAAAAALAMSGLPLTAFADGCADANITTQTIMTDIHENPSLKAIGFLTYSKDKYFPQRQKWADKTLEEYVGSWVAEDCANGLNLMIENYNNGVPVAHKIYSAEEIAADSSKEDASIYYFPAETAGAKYALILSGNVGTKTAEMKECVSTAYCLHEMGYAAFVMRYRVWPENDDNAPLEDVGHAIRYITDHAAEFGVQAEQYAVLGHSSGGHITGIFGSDQLGYKNYGVPKPGALILAYPVVNFSEAEPVYHVAVDCAKPGLCYYQLSVSAAVTDDFPPVYFWYGKDDLLLIALNYQLQGPALRRALIRHHVPYKEVVYDHAAHGIGLANGTEAEGWLNDAAAFWEEQT